MTLNTKDAGGRLSLRDGFAGKVPGAARDSFLAKSRNGERPLVGRSPLVPSAPKSQTHVSLHLFAKLCSDVNAGRMTRVDAETAARRLLVIANDLQKHLKDVPRAEVLVERALKHKAEVFIGDRLQTNRLAERYLAVLNLVAQREWRPGSETEHQAATLGRTMRRCRHKRLQGTLPQSCESKRPERFSGGLSAAQIWQIPRRSSGCPYRATRRGRPRYSATDGLMPRQTRLLIPLKVKPTHAAGSPR
jgi:hypothetical protein